MSTEKEREIKKAIAALESNRKKLGDAVVETSVAALKQQLDNLKGTGVKAQRKLMTILFVDIVDSTRLFGSLDPEDTMTILDNSLKELATPIEKFGGKVTRFMGDGYMAVFGLTRATENDPEMAVRAGLEVIKVSDQIAARVQKRWDKLDFQVRVGINTGLVVSGGRTEAADTVMGTDVNLASRLEAVANPSEVLVSQNTYQHIRGLFEIHKGKKLRIKGFADPIQVYSVISEKHHAFHETRRGIEGITLPMIGREMELELLKSDALTFFTNKHMYTTCVFGEVGIGKSRLIFEFENWLGIQPMDFLSFFARAKPDRQSTPYQLIREMLLEKFHIWEEDTPEVIHEKFITGLSEFYTSKTLDKSSLALEYMLGLNVRDTTPIQKLLEKPQQLHDLGHSILKDYIFNASNHLPLIFYLDDLQWADESSLDLLATIFYELRNNQILVLIASRYTSDHQENKLLENPQTSIDLKPLSEEDCEILLQEVFKSSQKLPTSLIDVIIPRIDGNPFFLEEIINMLIDSEVMVATNHEWRISEDWKSKIEVPGSLTGVIQARIESLSEPAQILIQYASVIGITFWKECIEFINETESGIRESDIDDILQTLLDKGIIQSYENSRFSYAEEWSFSHGILQEVAYETVLRQNRPKYHNYVVQWLIENGNSYDEHSILVANQFEKAGDLEDASQYLKTAAESALSSFALREANTLFTRALELTENDNFETRYQLLLAQEGVVNLLGFLDQHESILAELIDVCNVLGDEAKKLEVLDLRTWDAYHKGDFDVMGLRGQELITRAAAIHDIALLHKGYYATAWALFQLDNIEEALVHANQALKFAQDTKNLRAEGNALNILGNIKTTQGEFYAALMYLEGFLEVSRRLGDKSRELIALNNIIVCYVRIGKFSKAQESCKSMYIMAMEIGDRIACSGALMNLAWTSTFLQEWKDGMSYAQEGISIKRELNSKAEIAEGLMWLGHCHLGLNEYDEARNCYQEALDIRRESGQKSLAMGAIAALAKIASLNGDWDTAKTYCDEIVEFLNTGGNILGAWEPMRIYLTCIETYFYYNDDRAKVLLKDAYKQLEKEATNIHLEEDRENFFNAIPWNKKIRELVNIHLERIRK